MHSPDEIAVPLPPSPSGDHSWQIRFPESPILQPDSNANLSSMIEDKVRNKEFFYGLEVSARRFASPLDYNDFGTLLPLFTSIVWLSEQYAKVENLSDIPSIKLADDLRHHLTVMPHFSCYNVTEERLKEFLSLSYNNVLAIRGDPVMEEQPYKHTADMVRAIRNIENGDNRMTIAVGGYPEYHQEAKSAEDDIKQLHEKVNAGADFIITQVCFSSEKIIEFVRNCRAAGITVPIVIGLYIPDNIKSLNVMSRITGAKVAASDLETYTSLTEAPEAFREFAVQKAWNMFKDIIDAELDIYGVQFYTANRFETTKMFLAKLEKENIFSNMIN